MANDFDQILDECIDRINRGDTLEACLANYQQYAEKLEPLLRCMLGVQKPYTFTPSPDTKRMARMEFYAALDKRRVVPSIWARFVFRPWILTTVAVIVLAIVGFFGVRPMLYTPPGLVPSPEGNFAFLISDEVNAIGDFDNLFLTISRVGLQTAGESERWVEFEPEVKTVDVAQLQGDKAQEIWRGDVPVGQYSQAFIYVSEVRGKLKATGQTIEIKLPSRKLHLSKPFEVTADAVTSFTYDLTVVATGRNGKYILKPQVDQSGAQQKPNPGKGKGKK